MCWKSIQLKVASVLKWVWLVVDAINNNVDNLNFLIDDVSQLRQLELKAAFRAKSTCGVWRGCVGCVDGVHFNKLQKPSVADGIEDADRYFVARKNEYAMLCIAICDVERRFLY